MTAKADEIDDKAAPLIEHLVELRSRVLWSLAAFVVGLLLAFTVWNPIFTRAPVTSPTRPASDAVWERFA